jgi:drug/metabolite transporter (DMT)-like permease
MACWSPDALLPRLAALYHGGTTLNMIFWKFLIVGLVNMLFSLSTLSKANEQQHSRCRLVQHTFFPCTLGGSALVPAALAMLFTMATNFGFIASYMTTKAANAVLLIEMNPLWSAALGWLLLSDRLPLRTVVTIFAAVLCALVSALGSSVGDSEGGSANVSAIVPPGEIVPLPVRASWYGNLIALCTGFCFTGFLRAPARATCREPALRARLVACAAHAPPACVSAASVGLLRTVSCRFYARKVAGAPTAGLAMWGSLTCAVCAGLVAHSRGGTVLPEGAAFYGLVVTNGVLAGIAWVACIKASQYISAAEVGLILQSDMVVVPTWVFLGIGGVRPLRVATCWRVPLPTRARKAAVYCAQKFPACTPWPLVRPSGPLCSSTAGLSIASCRRRGWSFRTWSSQRRPWT